MCVKIEKHVKNQFIFKKVCFYATFALRFKKKRFGPVGPIIRDANPNLNDKRDESYGTDI
jgi:hypothetical protein